MAVSLSEEFFYFQRGFNSQQEITLKRYIFAVLLAAFSWSAHAGLIQLTDGYSGVYDPTNTYVPVGEIGPELYSFEFLFTDPAHQFEVTLAAPDDLVGGLDWVVTQGLYGDGLFRAGGQLLAGDSVTFSMGDGWAPTQALTIAAFDAVSPYVLGGPFSIISSDFGFVDDGGGNGGGGSNPVPVPGTLALLALGLLLLKRIGFRLRPTQLA